MNKYIKVCTIVLLMIFSFYYTEKVALYVQNNTPLKKEIMSYKNSNNINYVNAIVDGEYIIPGINGLEINVDKSYNKMKSINVFSENYLVYDQVKPEVSTSDFKYKIINGGNPNKNGVSIIINNNNSISSYFDSNNITYDFIDKTNYCIKSKVADCLKSKKRIVEPTLYLTNQNFLKSIDMINKGYIIYIDNSVSINYVYFLIQHIRYNNLHILKLNEHLTEKLKV